jgi:voltage-dependent potassium channel beta subunit
LKYRNLGRSGLQISELSFGSWITFGNQIDDSISRDLMVEAYDAGINFFDNAEVYADGRSEQVMGKIIKQLGWSRDSYILSSKVYFGAGGKRPTQKGLNRKHIVEACNDALRRLQVEYLDLYFCHRPDKLTPIEETVFTMHNLIQQGKILYWGTSEWSGVEIMEAHRVASANHLIGPVMEQPQYNMLHRDKVEVEYHSIYKTLGLGTTIWSPLASGILTGKYSKGISEDYRLNLGELSWLKEKNVVEDKLRKADRIVELAKELGCSSAQLSLAWCLKNPNVSSVILGASRLSQLRENLMCLDYVDLLSPEVLERIEGILQNKPALPPF